MDLKKIYKKIKDGGKNKLFSNLSILFLIALLLLITMSFFKNSNSVQAVNITKNDSSNNTETATKSSQNEEDIENKLKSILQQIEGVGRVNVMVYFESGEEQIPAVNINDNDSITEEKDNSGGTRNTTEKNNGSTVVITNDGDGISKPLIIKKNNPKISGVIVVAEGAEENITEIRIKKAVTDLFSISSSKVNVYPMKK